MGYYINPPDTDKEDWLAKHGKPISAPVSFNYSDTLPVCLIDNGWMSAAGICYSSRELEAFNSPDDLRPRKWFEVPLVDLEPYYKP